jgi:hypothetical protein
VGKIAVKTYVGGLAALAITFAASWTYWSGERPEAPFILGTLVFGGILCMACIFRIRVSEQSEISTHDIWLVAAVAMLGPFWAAVAALPCAVVVGRSDWLRTLYEASRSSVQVFLAGIVFSAVSEPLLEKSPELTAPVVYATFAAGVVLLAVNHVTDAGLLKVKYDRGLGVVWREHIEPYLLADGVNVLTAGLGVLALLKVSPIAALVVIGGSVGSQVLVYFSREQVKENNALRARVESLEKSLATSNTAFGTMIIRDLGQRDGYTHRHAAATATYAADLGREMKLDDTHVGRLRMAGLLHNIGMFGLPEDLLVATGRLNSIARTQLDEHPVRGEEALAAVSEFEEMAGWVRWHHERPDGRGYPDKLRGAWIPLEAKILSVAQAYAAMVLDQPRRPGMKPAEAREKLSAGIDTEFEGVVVRALLRLLDTESEGYRMADDHRFVFPSPESRGDARSGLPGPRHDEGPAEILRR